MKYYFASYVPFPALFYCTAYFIQVLTTPPDRGGKEGLEKKKTNKNVS